MSGRIVAVAAIGLASVCGLGTFAAGNPEPPRPVREAVKFAPIQGANGPAIKVTIGNLVLIASELQVERTDSTVQAKMQNVGREIRLVGHNKTSSFTISSADFSLPTGSIESPDRSN